MDSASETKSASFPYYALEEALELLDLVVKNSGHGPYLRESLVNALGHDRETGSSANKIGSLGHYGLISKDGDRYKLTETANRIVAPTSSDESALAITEAAFHPHIFGLLIEKYSGLPLPVLLPNIISREYGVAQKRAGRAAKVFKQTLEFANLYRNNRIEVPESEKSGATEKLPTAEALETTASFLDSGNSSSPPIGRPPTRLDTSTYSPNEPIDQGYSIPLSRGRTARLSLPRGMDNKDVERILGWIGLMREVLTEKNEDLPEGGDDTNKSTETNT